MVVICFVNGNECSTDRWSAIVRIYMYLYYNSMWKAFAAESDKRYAIGMSFLCYQDADGRHSRGREILLLLEIHLLPLLLLDKEGSFFVWRAPSAWV